MKAKAVYAVAKDTVEIREYDVDDSRIEPGQVLVKTLYSAISPGTEMDCVSGKESGWFHFPQQLGYCAAVEVVAIGEGVSDYLKGDVVLTQTSHGSHHLVDTTSIRAKVPATVPAEIAVWTHMALISMTALRVSRAELGDTAVVLGQGIVGNFAAQFFRAQGCRVIAVDRIASRLDISKRCGIEMVVDASTEDTVEAVRRLTDGRGAEIIVEATGVAAVALSAVDMAGQNAEMIQLGTPRGSYKADVGPLLRAIHRASPNMTLKGAHGGSIPSNQNQFMKHSLDRNARIVLDMIARGEFHVEPLLTRTIKPEEAPQAYRDLRDHPERTLAITMEWS